MRQQPTYYGDFSEIHCLERYLCIYIPHLSPEHPNINWASSPTVSPPTDPWQSSPQRGWFVAQSQGGVRPWPMHLPPLYAQSCPACLGDVKHWTGAAMCNLGLHSAISLGIKFQIYNALDETKGQLLFITVGLVGDSVCHVAWLLTSSIEHTARK